MILCQQVYCCHNGNLYYDIKDLLKDKIYKKIINGSQE